MKVFFDDQNLANLVHNPDSLEKKFGANVSNDVEICLSLIQASDTHKQLLDISFPRTLLCEYQSSTICLAIGQNIAVSVKIDFANENDNSEIAIIKKIAKRCQKHLQGGCHDQNIN